MVLELEKLERRQWHEARAFLLYLNTQYHSKAGQV